MATKPSPLIHFELPENTTGNYKAKCKHCSSCISGSNKTSSNFTTHLKRKHPKIYEETQKSGTEAKVTGEQTTVDSFISTRKYAQNDPRQCRALTSLVADNMLPLSIVESPSFRNYCHSLDQRFVVPSRKHLSTTLLTKKHAAIRTKLRDVLAEAEGVSLTLDLWSNRLMKGFLGITCHFILNWSMYSLMLECKRFKGRHTAESIYACYCEVTTSYKIEDKVITTVTDNGSNVVKAFSLPGYHDDPFHQERYKDEEEDDEEREIDAIDLHDSLEYVSEHDTCFAHTLQLVIKDGFKEIGAVRTILGKVATIVSHVRRSQSATEILEGERRLQAKNATRWNSELRSIKSILRVSEDKLRLLDTAHLTAHERNILEDLVEILSPFQEATDFTQGANIVTSSFVIPCIRGLKKSLETLSVTFNLRMVTALTDSLQIRMTKYESRELFMLASTLDPRFKLKWCIGDDEQEKVISILLQKAYCSQDISMDVTTTQEQEVPQPQVVEIATTSSEPLSKKRKQEPSKLLSYLFSDEDNLPPASTISNSLEAEISMYISEPCLPEQGDPLAFWKEHSTIYPKMSKLACHYLSIPASSGPVERLFSIGGKFFRPERCRLSDSVFEKLMNIKCNGHLV